MNEFNKVAVTPLEEWVEYLKTGHMRADTEAPGLAEARRKLNYYQIEPAERLAYDRHIDAIMIQYDVLGTAKWEGLIEGREEGRRERRQEGREEALQQGLRQGLEEGMERGKAQGGKEARMEAARNLKRMGISPDMIRQATQLSEEEIEVLGY